MPIRKPFLLLVLCLALLAGQSVQAASINFVLQGQAGAGLTPGNEVGSPTSSGAGGVLTGIIFDTDTSMLSIDVGWGSGNGFSDLTGDAAAMHIHGPADFFSNAGVKYPLNTLTGYDPSVSSGGFNGVVTIGAADVSDLLAGLFYINVHTAANAGGEIRGNLTVVPLPAAAWLFISEEWRDLTATIWPRTACWPL
jgi:hypothetical protein